MRPWMRVAGVTLAVVAVAGLAAILAVVYSGWYDSRATRPHTAPVNSLLEVALEQSIKVRAADIEVPELDDPARVRSGFEVFRAHCVQCHGAPGVAPEPFAMGLMPAPASLVTTARQWSAAEIYWVVRYGVKMTGMPAWQYRITDAAIWDVVAFMRVLPTLSATDYRAWDERAAPSRISSAAADPEPDGGRQLSLGDAQAGRDALHQYLCVTCHAIPGVVGANVHVGPPLQGIARQQYIAGILPNTPENMVRWLLDPHAVDPDSAMPGLGLSVRDARDIAAYLYTLD